MQLYYKIKIMYNLFVKCFNNVLHLFLIKIRKEILIIYFIFKLKIFYKSTLIVIYFSSLNIKIYL